METPEFPTPELAEVKAGDDRAMVMSRLQQLHDEAQGHLAQWSTRVLPDHELDVRAHALAAAAELRKLARFAQALAKVVIAESEDWEDEQAARLAAVLDGGAS
jgi:hypothetical protein